MSTVNNASSNSDKPKCLVPRSHQELLPTFWTDAAKQFNLVYYDEFVKQPNDYGPGVQAVFVTIDSGILDNGGLARLPDLKAVASYGVGFDHLNLSTLSERSVTVTNTPGVIADATAETAVYLMLSVARRAAAMPAVLAAGHWPGIEPGQDLLGRRLGIVGLGSVGGAVAKRCSVGGLGMRIVYHQRRRAPPELEASLAGAEFVPDLDSLIASSDVLLLACPLSDQTRHMLDARRLSLMLPTAFLVNVGRGGLVDTEALLTALRLGKIFGAGLDVTDPEPLPGDHPLLTEAAKLNVTVSPHVGTHTVDTMARLHRLCLDNLVRALAGQPTLTPPLTPDSAN